MATDESDSPLRIASLCHHLGRLCSEQELEVWDDVPAFQIAMKKAWCVDQVEIFPSDGGLYIIKFRSETPPAMPLLIPALAPIVPASEAPISTPVIPSGASSRMDPVNPTTRTTDLVLFRFG